MGGSRRGKSFWEQFGDAWNAFWLKVVDALVEHGQWLVFLAGAAALDYVRRELRLESFWGGVVTLAEIGTLVSKVLPGLIGVLGEAVRALGGVAEIAAEKVYNVRQILKTGRAAAEKTALPPGAGRGKGD